MNDFIYLNNKLFSYVNRKYESEEIGSKVERTLGGNGYKDISRPSVGRWSFSFEINYKNYLRIKSIYDTHTTITLKDWDGVSTYNVLWSNNFSPDFVGEDNGELWFTLTVELEEV